ncbi:MAG: tetratricopeptide repeat protein, partial [Flammeovirgaceae bacterium]|nr:tetratricopeptide repeat protein [Flammeovirgaceae bacterium]
MKSYTCHLLFLTFFLLHGLSAQMKKDKQEPDFKTKTLEMIKLVDNEIYKGNYEQAVIYAIDAVNTANAADAETLAKSLMTLSNAYTYKRNYIDALEYAIQAIVVQENNPMGSQLVLADGYFQAGKVYQAWGIPQKAVEYFQKAYILYEEIQNTTKIPMVLEVLGDCYFQLKDEQNSLVVLQKHIQLTSDKKDKRPYMKSLSLLALIFKESREYEKALAYTNDYLAVCEGLKDEWAIAEARHNMGYLYRQVQQLQESVSSLQYAIALFEKLQNPQPDAFNNLGITNSYLKEFQKAAEYYDKALMIYQQTYDAQGIAETKNYRATNEYLQGKYSQALKWVSEAIDI